MSAHTPVLPMDQIFRRVIPAFLKRESLSWGKGTGPYDECPRDVVLTIDRWAEAPLELQFLWQSAAVHAESESTLKIYGKYGSDTIVTWIAAITEARMSLGTTKPEQMVAEMIDAWTFDETADDPHDDWVSVDICTLAEDTEHDDEVLTWIAISASDHTLLLDAAGATAFLAALHAAEEILDQLDVVYRELRAIETTMLSIFPSTPAVAA